MSIMKRKKNNLARAAMTLLLAVVCAVSYAQTTTIKYTATEKIARFEEIQYFTGATALQSYTFDTGTGEGTVVYAGTVTALDKQCMYQTNTLTSIVIPASVTAIEEYAFSRCEKLTTVTIPEGVTKIGFCAFSNSGLTSLTLPSTITSMSQSFYGCQDLATLTLTPGITTLSQSFYNCPKLTTVNIPGSVKEIGTSDFSSCTGLTTVVLNEGTEKIEFSGCTNLKTINFPSTTKEIYFKNCPGLETVTLPEGVTRISSFWGCSSLKQINIPKSVTYVGWFRDCNKLEKVIIADVASWCNARHYDANFYGPTKMAGKLYLGTVASHTEITDLVIPEGVTTIKSCAFYGLPNITSVTIPSTLTTWEYKAFCGCTGVTDVWCLANPNTLAWSESENDFAAEKATKMHVCGADVWTTKFPSANATFVEMTALALSEETDNSGILALKNGMACDITLKRTLKAGSYNTFAAPFDIPAATLTAKGIKAKKLTSSTFINGVLTLNFADATTIEAGKPYLVKVTADLADPTFNGVTVNSTLTATQTASVDFVPTMGKTLVTGSVDNEGNARSVLSLGGGNKLFHPTVVNTPDNADSYIKGFRAYFQLKDDGIDAHEFNLDFDAGMTGIVSMDNVNVNDNDNWRDLNGRKLSGKPTAKGVYILNGKKVIVK